MPVRSTRRGEQRAARVRCCSCCPEAGGARSVDDQRERVSERMQRVRDAADGHMPTRNEERNRGERWRTEGHTERE